MTSIVNIQNGLICQVTYPPQLIALADHSMYQEQQLKLHRQPTHFKIVTVQTKVEQSV